MEIDAPDRCIGRIVESEEAVKAANPPRKQTALLGLGLDGDDGEKRLTRGDDFVLLGGSEETHARMQETTIKVTERLDKRGKRLGDASVGELKALFEELGS